MPAPRPPALLITQVTHTVSMTLPSIDRAQLFGVRGVFRYSFFSLDYMNNPCPQESSPSTSYNEADDIIFTALPDTFV